MSFSNVRLCVAALLAATLFPAIASAHAMMDRSEPAAGSTVTHSPPRVTIWFTQEVEPAFSLIEVLDADGKQVDNRDVRVDPSDKRMLTVTSPDLAGGSYKVVWHVVSVDTHRTQGSFKFTVKP